MSPEELRAEIDALRVEIDRIDDEIAPLLERRMGLTAQVAAVKRKTCAPIHRPAREQAILSRLGTSIAPEYLPALETIYEAVFRASREIQEGLS
ncbi:MAG: chorismate mutase [Oscillospiraceae bacterium]|nr:chorismate mutase [Oscillospiraceae bacterium]